MHHHNLSLKLVAAILLVAFVGLAPMTVIAQSQEQIRAQAMELFDANNFVAALPLLEKAAVAYPNDVVVASRLGFVLYALGTTAKDPAVRKQHWQRARTILLQAQANGDNSNLTHITLESLSREKDLTAASDVPFSDKKAAEAEIRKGEEAFVRGELEKALAAYQRALELDPRLYEAALYAGDMEFRLAHASKDGGYRKEHFGRAGIWFAKAIAIDPDRETAHRYWGDSLDEEGKTEEARDRFIEAIIAEPYSGNRAYVGLSQWGGRHKVSLTHPKVEIPTELTSKKPGEVNITLDSSILKGDSDGSAAWMMYGIIRAGWMDKKDGARSEKFAKAHPNETTYRHSIAEEIEALRGVLESVRVQQKEKSGIKLASSLENLLKLEDAGLLEAYIFFARPDEGIVRDYFPYRKAKREKLKEYWVKFVVKAR
jgi:tetratricopeptide (TPR) repeat protein